MAKKKGADKPARVTLAEAHALAKTKAANDAHRLAKAAGQGAHDGGQVQGRHGCLSSSR
jgi:hypothetical protein